MAIVGCYGWHTNKYGNTIRSNNKYLFQLTILFHFWLARATNYTIDNFIAEKACSFILTNHLPFSYSLALALSVPSDVLYVNDSLCDVVHAMHVYGFGDSIVMSHHSSCQAYTRWQSYRNRLNYKLPSVTYKLKINNKKTQKSHFSLRFIHLVLELIDSPKWPYTPNKDY